SFAALQDDRRLLALGRMSAVHVHLCSYTAVHLFLFLMVFGLLGCGAKARPAAAIAALRVAATQPSFKQRLTEAKDLFYRSVAGDRDALPEGQKILQELGGGESPDPQVVAYTAAAELLEANRASMPWDKVRLAREGLALQDKAVASAPDNLEVRFLRGVTDFQMPEYLGRHDMGVADLAAVAEVAEQASRTGRLDKRAAAASLVYHGKALEQQFRIPEAIAAWQAAIRISPDSPGGIDAVKHLAEHGVKTDQPSAGL
ncbi:MAG TPA: hypothetical protein VIL86_15270, partial [Tepidisphaeraceae bacterium]